MAGEWIECALADACSSVDYGLTASASDREVGPRFLRITDIVTGHIDWNAVPHVAADEATAAKYRLHDGDVVLARTGASTGASAYIQNPPPAVFASYLVRLQAKPEFDARFLAYYLRSEDFWTFIRGVLGDKSAQPNASASTMTKAPLRAPKDKGEQRAIAHVLGTLDDKIELNRRMNETLEAMARALFKSWFVDFDPVRAKAEGRDPGLPQPLAELFPDSFEDSALGEIPRGWAIGRVGDLCDAIYSGGTPSTQNPEYWDGDIPWLSSGETRDKFITDTEKRITAAGVSNSSTRPASALSTVIASAGQGNTRGQTSLLALDSYVNQSVVVLRANSTTSSPLHLFFDLERRYEEFRRVSDGHSSRGSLTTKLLAGLDAVLPPGPFLLGFDNQVAPIVARAICNLRESRALAGLRDALLPKLVLGKLRVEKPARFLSGGD